MSRLGRRGLAVAGVALAVVCAAGIAFAFWVSADSGNPAGAGADAIGAGNTPTLGGVSGQNVTINWTPTTTSGGAPVGGYSVARYSVSSGGTPTAASGGCSGTFAALTCTEQSVPGGTWYYTVTPKISLWAGAESGRLAVSVDATPPVTTDNSVSIGSAWFNATVTVTLTPTDTGGSGVAATYFTTDGSTPTTGSSQGTSVALSADGVFTVKYFSVDNAGNAEAVKTAGTAIRIDKTNPTAATLSVPSAIRNGQALTNAATDPTVNGASSGVSSVSYYYCFGGGCTPATLIGTSATGPSYSATWSSQPADGTYRVQAVVTDGAGNTAASSIVSTLVDNTAPSGGSVSYTNGYFTAASVPVTFTNGTDGGSGISTATTQLQRASTPLTSGSCGTLGSPSNIGSAGPASPYSDTSVASGNCYQYRYLVSDNAGNIATYTSASVAKVDTTGPTFVLTRTGANVSFTGTTVYFKNGGSGSFTVTATDPESGIGSSTFPAAPTGWTVSGTGNARTYTLGATNANSSLTVSATNGAGTASGNQTITITLDNTAPTATAGAIAPIDNTTGTQGFIHQGGQYYVYASGTDAGSGIATLTVDVSTITTGQNAVPLVAGSYPAFGTPYGFRTAAITANTTLAAGPKSYTGTLTDNVGNTVTPGSGTVNVDNTNPTGSITAPSNGYATASTTVSSNSADTGGAGITSVVFQYSPQGAGTWSTIAVDTVSPYSATWDTTALTDGGSYDLRAITTDNASNTFTSTTVTVTVDRTTPTAPSTPVLALASDSGVAGDNLTNDTTATFTGTAEAGSTVKIFDGVTQVGSATATGGNYSVTTSVLSSGSHTITATATDAAGNASASSAGVVITIDTTVPTPTGATLANGGVVKQADAGDTVTITFSEQLNASTMCSTWTNSGTQTLTGVTVTITQAATDTLGVTSASCTFNLGSLPVGDYVSTTATFTSTVSWDPTAKTLTITLGTMTSGTIKTNVSTAKQDYTPVAALTDLAGNAMAATLFTDANKSGF